MKLHLTLAQGLNTITGYGDGYVLVNQQRHEQSLIILPDTVHTPWPVADIVALCAGHLEALAALRPELVLLGTGRRQRMPQASLLPLLPRAGIGLEVMDTHAACRTYNYLVAEGRKVAAALILEA